MHPTNTPPQKINNPKNPMLVVRVPYMEGNFFLAKKKNHQFPTQVTKQNGFPGSGIAYC
jgi:hypothetical protein